MMCKQLLFCVKAATRLYVWVEFDMIGLCSLTPFSTIFQLYRGGQFYWWMKPGFELTTLVVIGTDCIGSYKSSYHTITAMTAPDEFEVM